MALAKPSRLSARGASVPRHFGASEFLWSSDFTQAQWQREFARFAERGNPGHHGWRFAETVLRYDAVQESPTTKTLPRYRPDRRVVADVVIVEKRTDQKLNTSARSLKRIASPYAIVLTGDTARNRLEELISIVRSLIGTARSHLGGDYA